MKTTDEIELAKRNPMLVKHQALEAAYNDYISNEHLMAGLEYCIGKLVESQRSLGPGKSSYSGDDFTVTVRVKKR
jgi:hypothetical protein